MTLHSEIVIAPYRVLACTGELPQLYSHYRERADLVEEIDLASDDGLSFFAVGRDEWPSLVVTQRFSPSGYGNYPGILIVPETATAFIGAGERLLAYRLDPRPARLWMDTADCGFSRWSRHGEFALMSAELELAAWTTSGTKLWTMFVEPPWEYTVVDETVQLDVMGTQSSFPIAVGPQRETR